MPPRAKRRQELEQQQKAAADEEEALWMQSAENSLVALLPKSSRAPVQKPRPYMRLWLQRALLRFGEARS